MKRVKSGFTRFALPARGYSLLALVAAALLFASACGGGGGSSGGSVTPPAATRTWKLGFSTFPARPTVNAVIAGIDRFSPRAELVAIHEELPWRDLLAGMTPDAILDRDKAQLIAYLRGKGLQLYFMADATDGLSRAEEAPQLRALGRSITEPAVQLVYRNYVAAFARRFNPEYIGLAAETNLVRAAAAPAVYAAMMRMAADSAAELRAAGNTATLLFSVQVETAWGVLVSNGNYTGVDRDYSDFPFAQVIGLSSYPYFGYTQPENIPANYYSRLLAGHNLPAMVVEGGWTSAAVGSVSSSPEIQARYITRHASLLESIAARACIQLLFSDVDATSYPPPLPPNLALFTQLGLVDTNLNAKPALAAWDALFARRYAP